jgi:branched-chain amino acid transport system ATP-binding protein
MAALLEVRNLHAWYGKSHILRGVGLHVNRGEIVSLLGRNGAGRSTTLKAVMGQVEATGSVFFNGLEMLGLKAFQIAHQGIAYVPESRDIFPTLTVAQNLLLGKKRGRQSRWSLDDMYRMYPQLQARRHTLAGVLSGGEQQMLTLCRALMGDPDLIMIDEPTEGLAPAIVEQVAGFLLDLKRRGMAILLVEQKLAIALDISERVYLMGHGTVVFEGTPQAMRENAPLCSEWLEV